MLQYFNSRQQQAFISPITRKPYISCGISIQSPLQFQKPYSMINHNTFFNPFISYEKDRLNRISFNKQINQNWTKKTDINQLETETSFLKKNHILAKMSPHHRYYHELEDSKARFRRTKGQFTNFLERNHNIQLFGPLQGIQRDQSKSQITKALIANKSKQKISQKIDKLTKYRSRLFQSRQPFQQKHQLKKTRLAFRENFKNELQQRKSQKVDLYTLPQMLNKTHLNMKYSLEDEDERLESSELTLLSDKSRERLQNLRDFGYTQRYFTLDVRTKNQSKSKDTAKQK